MAYDWSVGAWDFGNSAEVTSGAFKPVSGQSWSDDAFGSGNQFNHNEAIFDWQRNETSAQTARDWSKMMSDTSVQRSVDDYKAAGFSPLAALSGGGASTPAVVAGSGSRASASSSTGSGPKTIVSALSTMAMMVGAAVGSAARMASATAAASKNNALAEILETQLKANRSASAARRFVNRAIKF